MKALFLLVLWIGSSSLFAHEPKNRCVLVVGGAGYIGSCVNDALHESGYDTVVLDNLSQGHVATITKGTFIEGDLGDKELLNSLFSTYKIDAVMHFAAFLDVGESTRNPLKYYLNNVSATLNLLESIVDAGVEVFIFSSTAAIFGIPETRLIDETHPTNPISPYGRSKYMIEQILHDLDVAYGLRYSALRYFNAAGGDSKGIKKLFKKNQSNLIPVVLRNMQKPHGSISLFGTDYPTSDGTGVRDYIHIEDLASAHIAAMERLLSGAPSACYNLGNGTGFSVKEVIESAQAVTGLKINVIEAPRRQGDPAYSVADTTKAKKELNWNPIHPSLKDMIEDTWNSMR